jgi:hypothetical protein
MPERRLEKKFRIDESWGGIWNEANRCRIQNTRIHLKIPDEPRFFVSDQAGETTTMHFAVPKL